MEGGTKGGEPLARGRIQRVPDPRPPPLTTHDAGLAQDAQVMRDRRLGKPGRRGDVARTDGAIGGELPCDREPCRVRERPEEPDIRVVGRVHPGHSIDQLLY
jgi:hypothetical protein